MDKEYTVSLFGHRHIDDCTAIERALESAGIELLTDNDRVSFLIGRDGDFDIIAASVINRIKKIYDNGSLTWVMPYPKAEYLKDPAAYELYYDNIIVYSKATHPKTAITERNRHMIDLSDSVIFYVVKRSNDLKGCEVLNFHLSLQYARRGSERCTWLVSDKARAVP